MLALHREEETLPWLASVGAFALGAAATFLTAFLMERLRPQAAPMSDDVVQARVRERIATLVGRPDAIDVSVENGVVRLKGTVTPEERDELLTQLVYMPGIVRLRSALATRSS